MVSNRESFFHADIFQPQQAFLQCQFFDPSLQDVTKNFRQSLSCWYQLRELLAISQCLPGYDLRHMKATYNKKLNSKLDGSVSHSLV